jgi:hypothetical protein
MRENNKKGKEKGRERRERETKRKRERKGKERERDQKEKRKTMKEKYRVIERFIVRKREELREKKRGGGRERERVRERYGKDTILSMRRALEKKPLASVAATPTSCTIRPPPTLTLAFPLFPPLSVSV